MGSVIHDVSKAKFSLTEPVSLQDVYVEFHDYNMARLCHKRMAVDSKSSSTLAVDFL